MSGSLDPTVQEFVPQSSRKEEYHGYASAELHRTHYQEDDFRYSHQEHNTNRESYNDRFYDKYEDYSPTCNESSYPSSQELKAFYQELQSVNSFFTLKSLL